MMKTALSIIQTMRLRMGLSVPSTLLSLTDPDELQLLHLLYETCEDLRRARCWVQQKRKHTFATTASRAQYALPQDFYSFLPLTQYNADTRLLLVGPMADDEFGAQLYGNASAGYNYSFRVFGPDENPATTGGQVEITPTPDAVVNLSYEYLTRTFIVPATYVMPTAPKETVTADTDLVMFDDDLTTIGLRAKWIKEHGGDYKKDEDDFLARIDRAVCRMKGVRVGNFGGSDNRPRYVVPFKSWSIP